MTPEQQSLADKLTNLQRLTVLGVDYTNIKAPVVQSELAKLLWEDQKEDFNYPDDMRMAFFMGACMALSMACDISEIKKDGAWG